MKKLFLCGTQYHVLSASARVLNGECEADIGLSESIPGRQALAERLKKSGLFGQVFTPADRSWPAPAKTTGFLFRQRQRIGVRRAGWRVKPADYDEVVVYNDWTPFGRWLQDCKAPYVLGEDTRNFLFQPHVHLDAARAEPDYARRLAKGEGYFYWGDYPGVTAVEVTDPQVAVYHHEKLRVFDLLGTLDGFDREKKARLRQVFVQQELPESDEPVCLLMPRSFYVDGELPSQEVQDRLVKDTAERYAKGYRLFIKTHPRDTTDYEALFPDAVVLDRFMPSELLDYCFEVRFARAVGLRTASVRNLRCADEKICLEDEYMAPYENGLA
ncbi:MAG: hypothetical protein IJ484_06235 [Oscillospiraceae bacterium]|nr:hypothetical protein [Oscillospiraceae bacterium]